MSEENKAVSKRFFEAWNARDMAAFDEVYAPDAVDHDTQNPFREMGAAESAKRFCEMYATAYSDGRYDVHSRSPRVTSSSRAGPAGARRTPS
jgi:hypothetical protein